MTMKKTLFNNIENMTKYFLVIASILTGIIGGGGGMSYALLHAWAHVLIFIISAIGFVFGIFSLYMLSDKLNK